MSHLLIVTRPTLVAGFQLAGVNAFAAEDVETAQELITGWLEAGEIGLLAIDEGLFSHMDPLFIKLLEGSTKLPFLTIPGGEAIGPEVSRKYRIAEMIRQAIGVHITFKGEEPEVNET
jgi:vacuolar-type H+-ATPase subunit F/Vma7